MKVDGGQKVNKIFFSLKKQEKDDLGPVHLVQIKYNQEYSRTDVLCTLQHALLIDAINNNDDVVLDGEGPHSSHSC